MRPKLLITIQNLKTGGAEKVLLSLLENRIFQEAFAITVLCYTTPQVPIHANNITLITPKLQASTNIINKISNFITKVTFTKRLIEKEQFDIVLSVMLTSNIICLLTAGSSTPLVISEHNVSTHNFTRKFAQLLAKILYRKSAAIICVSNGVRGYWEKIVSHSNYLVIYNPIYHTKISELSKKDMPTSINYEYILGVGRLEKVKGFDLLINAFSQIEDKNIKLLILGEGAEKSLLLAQVETMNLQNRVFIFDFDPNPYPYYKHSKCFVTSSKHEGLPMAQIEALFCKANIVSFNCESGPSEILANGKFGRLVEPENITALTLAIDEALEQPTIFNENELNQHYSLFDADHIATQYKNILYNCIKKK